MAVKYSFRLPLKKRVGREPFFTAFSRQGQSLWCQAFQAARSLRAERRLDMLTLQELKRISDVPGDGEKPPTAKQLRESGLAIVQEQLGLDFEIFVYQNGYVLYQAGNHSTVFPLHACKDYFYLSGRNTIHLPEQFFYHGEWYFRLVLEGEDRLNRNHEEKERSWKVSYSAVSEEWAAMENLAESMAEQLARQETVEEMLQFLTEKQKRVVWKYYLQEETQEQISEELGISQQAVSEMLSRAIHSIRKKYPAYQNLSSDRMCCREDKA